MRERPEQERKTGGDAPGRRGGKRRIGTFGAVLAAGYALLALALALALLLIDGRHVRFYLNGDAEETVEYAEDYADPGCSAVSVGRFFGEGKSLTVERQGHVNPMVPGDYELRYVARYFFYPYSVVRLVHVVDSTPPQISLNWREGYEPSWFGGYEEEGYSAYDLRDGDLTDRVQREDLGDRIVYTVTDTAGNTAVAERRPNYSLGMPEIRLLGEERQTLGACISYTDPGVSVQDEQGRDMSSWLHSEGTVIPWQPGDYELRYWIENDQGRRVEKTRHVTVEPQPVPEAVEPEQKTIYLTFDDGPSLYTDRLLDVLGAYGVKATFFVTDQQPEYLDCIGRAFREGHSIGVHTSCHEYGRIYASEEAYLEDFRQVLEIVREQTGTEPKIFRFPGGSDNTVSRFNPGIMTRLSKLMNDMGYQYFDWNLDSGDTGGITESDQIVQSITEGVRQQGKYSIILQHDIKGYSVAAVERVILWGLENGYTFAALEPNSPTTHHQIAN